MLARRLSSTRIRARLVLALAWAACGAAPAAVAWLVPGHRRLTIEAIRAASTSLPAFFRDGAAIAAEAAVDPDVWRNRGTPELGDREALEHFVDLELLRGSALPERRSQYQRLLGRLGLEPRQVGAAPYAIVEHAERLALCFAEHRRWPENAGIRSKCLLVAGWLSHYAADLTQPLHTTIHHDGRARADGSSPESGIHRQVDALLNLADVERRSPSGAKRTTGVSGELATRGAVEPIGAEALWPAVRSELDRSHALVDAVYALEAKLGSKPPKAGEGDPEVVAFALERERAAVDFVARLFLWSWERSAKLELPDWLDR